jgi:SOS-response transcriptional repressor LexA
MGRVLRFPFHDSTFTVCVPFGSSDEDEFEAIAISDDSLTRGTIYPGDVVVIKLGLVRAGGLHAVLTPTGSKFVGFLVEVGNDLVSIECNNDDYEPETFRRDEIKILGRVVQVYPGGDIRERWELISSPRPAARRRARSGARAK